MLDILRKIAIFAFLIALFTAQNSYSNTPKILTIFAESNLSSALSEISRMYSQRNNTIVSVEFGPASEMISRVEEGEASDLFISAHKIWIDNLKQKGLIDIYNINHITDDNLVIVTSSQNKDIPRSLQTKDLSFGDALKILNENRFDLVIDNRASSLGQHSLLLMENNKYRAIRLFKKLPEDRSSAISLISENPNIYSIMLSSQVYGNEKFRTVAALKNRKIYYQALIIAGDNMKNAREFSNFLKSKEAQEVFRKNGFMGHYDD